MNPLQRLIDEDNLAREKQLEHWKEWSERRRQEQMTIEDKLFSFGPDPQVLEMIAGMGPGSEKLLLDNRSRSARFPWIVEVIDKQLKEIGYDQGKGETEASES